MLPRAADRPRRLFKAALRGVLAPAGEGAARGPAAGVRHQARDGPQPGAAVLHAWQGVEEARRVGVEGVVEDILQCAVLHDAAGVDDAHAVADLRHDAQVVGDHEHGGAVLPLELLHHVQHLGLDGHIQGGGGLVGNEQLRVADEGHGDNHPLLHTAGKCSCTVKKQATENKR